MLTTGPTRLIFISAAKFSYAEVDLTKPLHLVGPNNVGKTTLVNVLQLLYVDKESHMSFPGYSWRDTKSYYFPNRQSYVLFECMTPEGMQVVGAYGKGPAEGHDIQRFAFSGEFEKGDFLNSTEEGPVPREVETVKQTLSLKEFRELEARNLRAALTGIGESDGLNLGLVPVRDHNGYSKFRDLFKGLIRLRQLDQSALKETLCSTYASEVESLEVNLKEAHAEEFETLQRHRRDIEDLERIEPDIEEALRLAHRQSALRRRLIETLIQLLQARSRNRTVLRAAKRRLRHQLQKTESALQKRDKRKRVLEEKRDKLNRKLGRLEGEEEELTRLTEEFSGFNPEQARSRIDELEDKRSQLLADIKSVDTDDPEQIRSRRDRIEKKIHQLQKRLDGIEDLMGPLLKKRLGKKRLQRLFQILNPRLLDLNANGEDIVLSDLDTLLQRIDEQDNRFEEGRWHFPGGHLSLDALSAPDLADYTDPARIEDELKQHRKEYKRLDHRLETARDVNAKREEAEKIGQRVEHLRSRLTKYKEAVEAEERLESVRSEIDNQKDKLKRTKETLADEKSDTQRLKQKRREHRSQLAQLEEKDDVIEKRIEELPSPSPAWTCHLTVTAAENSGPQSGQPSLLSSDESSLLLPSKEPQGTSGRILRLADEYEDTQDQKSRVSSRLQTTLDRIHEGTYEEYKKETRGETLDELRDQKEGLAARRHTLKTLWDELMTGLGRKVNDLLSSLDAVQSVVDRINRRLRGTSVSDLKRLRLEVTPIKSTVDLLKRFAEQDAMPLFSSKGAREEDAGRLRSLLQDHPQIHLTDLFNVGFAVTTADGETKRYEGLDNIQSNGTSITIKVLVHLVLIGDLLKDDALRLPFYLDEASSLDESNLEGVVQAATDMGFVPVLASPTESTAASHLYYLQSEGGRVYLGPEHRVELRRKEMSDQREPLGEESLREESLEEESLKEKPRELTSDAQ